MPTEEYPLKKGDPFPEHSFNCFAFTRGAECTDDELRAELHRGLDCILDECPVVPGPRHILTLGPTKPWES